MNTQHRRFAGAALLTLALLGCQGRGDVSGTVTFQNKPVVYGTVLLVASDGRAHQGNIAEDGAYAVRGVAAGPARVAVSSPDPATPLMAREDARRAEDEQEMRRRAALRGRWFAIPATYGDPAKSPLTVEVRGGDNHHDIELK